MLFPKTVEIFKKIARNVESVDTDIFRTITEYIVTDKQLNWLFDVYCKEIPYKDRGSLDTRLFIGVKDDEGNLYTFSYNKRRWNVPHYIPNRASYGCKYIISICTNQTKNI